MTNEEFIEHVTMYWSPEYAEHAQKLVAVAELGKKVRSYTAHSCDCKLTFDDNSECDCGFNEFWEAIDNLERE